MSPTEPELVFDRLDRLDPEGLPGLAAFLAGYLHQDWMLDYVSPAAAAYDYLSRADTDAVAALAAEWAVLAAAARIGGLDQLNDVLRLRFRSGWHATSQTEIDAVSAELQHALRFGETERGSRDRDS